MDNATENDEETKGLLSQGPSQSTYSTHSEANRADGTLVTVDVILERDPVVVLCPHCHELVRTVVSFQAGGFFLTMCVLCFLVAIVLIVFVGFGCTVFGNYCKDAQHVCPKCRQTIGVVGVCSQGSTVQSLMKAGN